MQLAYGKGQVDLENVPGHCLGSLKPNSTQSALALEDVHERIRNYFSGSRTTSALRHHQQTTIVVPDKTRNCAGSVLLPEIVRQLELLDISHYKITILLANGSHVAHSGDEVEDIVGPEIKGKIRILEHDARNAAELKYFGKTDAGTPVWLNKHVVGPRNLIVLGTVVHHYFAGFGGGPKMIMPGCAGYETIRANHALTIDPVSRDIHPGCRCGSVAGNPLQLDITDTLQMANVRISAAFTAILNNDGDIIDLFCGDINQTHMAACEAVDGLYRADIEKPADLVIASCGGFPKDINLIQAHKTIYNAFHAVKPGGVLIILAECSQGIGSQTFMDYFNDGSEEMIDRLLTNYTLNGTTALSISQKCKNAKVILISSLDETTVRHIGMIPVPTLRSALAVAADLLPRSPTYYIMENGSLTVTRIVP
jgi:nickel-dependent lactate racemase